MSSYGLAKGVASDASVAESSFSGTVETSSSSSVLSPLPVLSTNEFAFVESESSSSLGKDVYHVREDPRVKKILSWNGSAAEILLVAISLLAVWATSVSITVLGALAVMSEVRYS